MTDMLLRSIALIAAAQIASSARGEEPVFLVTRGDTFYRVRGAPPFESFQLSNPIVAMSSVHAGSVVANCQVGDVIAIDGTQVFRLDNAITGTPTLTPIGQLSHGNPDVTDVVIRGQTMHSIGGAVYGTWDTSTFQRISRLDLQPGQTNSTGGFTFGSGFGWILGSGSNNLIRVDDPPTVESWQVIGPVGYNAENSDLEWYRGELWGAMELNGSNTDQIGTFDLQTGAFTIRFANLGISPHNGSKGLAIVTVGCAGDVNSDGRISIEDLVVLLGNFATSGTDAADGDLNGDQIVDLSDLAMLLAAFGTNCD